MPIYQKPSKDLVYDLINASNPTLETPLTVSNTNLGVPSAVTIPGNSLVNSQIKISAAPGGAYIGSTVLNYRRLSFNSLFRSVVVQVNKYSPNQASGSSTAIVFTVYNLLPIINSLYGMNLTTDDVADGNLIRGTVQENGFYTSTLTVAAKATSLGFTGTFALKWRGAPQDLASMISVTDLPIRKFPGGNVFDGNHAVVVSNMAYGIDWTAFINSGAGPWIGYPNSIAGAGDQTVSFGDRFIDELNRLYSRGLVKPTNAAPAYSYQSWGGVVYDLSTQAGRDAAPLANSKYYNRVMIWTVPDADTAKGCGAGQHYIHYNV